MSRHHPFTIPLDQYTLGGSIILPDGASPDQQVPVAVFVGDPGPYPLTRHTDQGTVRWPMAWAEAFATEGVGSFCYDQRGGGITSGDYADANREDLLTEAREVVAMALAQAETSRCAAIGWADGASFALQLAAEGVVDAVVLLAPPFRTAEGRYEAQVRDLARRGGFSDRVVALRLQKWRDEMTAMSRRVEEGEARSTQEIGGQSVSLNLNRFLQTATFDPAGVAASVRKPVLLLHGEADAIIPPDESAMLASELQCPCRRITYPKVEHFLYRHADAALDAARWLAQTLHPVN